VLGADRPRSASCLTVFGQPGCSVGSSDVLEISEALVLVEGARWTASSCRVRSDALLDQVHDSPNTVFAGATSAGVTIEVRSVTAQLQVTSRWPSRALRTASPIRQLGATGFVRSSAAYAPSLSRTALLTLLRRLVRRPSASHLHHSSPMSWAPLAPDLTPDRCGDSVAQSSESCLGMYPSLSFASDSSCAAVSFGHPLGSSPHPGGA